MENILYLDDYINFWNKKLNKILVIKPYKDTLLNGHIIDRDKFIKRFSKIIIDNKLNKNIFNNAITIIINSSYTKEDKRIITDVFEELNYKNIKFINEINYLNVNKNNLIINYNDTYFYFYYQNHKGNIDMLMLLNNNITNAFITEYIKLLKKKNVYLFGKSFLDITNKLDKEKINYYYYEESVNLILNLILQNL